MSLSLNHYLVLGAMLFAVSVVGIFLNRRNLIVLLMAIELMLLAVNLNFIAFSHFLGNDAGQQLLEQRVEVEEVAIGLRLLDVVATLLRPQQFLDSVLEHLQPARHRGVDGQRRAVVGIDGQVQPNGVDGSTSQAGAPSTSARWTPIPAFGFPSRATAQPIASAASSVGSSR